MTWYYLCSRLARRKGKRAGLLLWLINAFAQSSRQIKRPDQKNGHLCPCDRIFRAIIPISTPGRDSLIHQLLDPRCRPITGRHIPKAGATSYSRRYVACSILGAKQKDGHLGTGDGMLGTEISISTTSRNTFRRELFDPYCRPITGRHISKACTGANVRRYVG